MARIDSFFKFMKEQSASDLHLATGNPPMLRIHGELVRIDMPEFMEKHSVARLIGAPPGYVGYEEGGYLTEAVRRKPYSVVLLDEVEKAHPDVFNILLQVLEDGRLTDSHGRTVDFRNTVVVMTSNLGSAQIQELVGDQEAQRAAVMDAVNAHFRPEFINRIDEVVVFEPLAREQIAGIAEIQMGRLRKRLAERELSLELSMEAMDKLIAVGFDPVYGARPLKRAIQRWIENPLAQQILAGQFVPGASITAPVIAKALEDRLAKFKLPKQVFIVPELPRNTMGKVQKNLLRDQYKDIYAPQ